MPASALSETLFRQACGQFATGVAIAAVTDSSGTPHGLTINSFTSVSMKPPLVLICIDKRAAILDRFLEASHYSVNILPVEHEELSNRFATSREDRFNGVSWRSGVTGAPLIDGSIAALECETAQVIDAGDHSILIAEAVAAEVTGGVPLVYLRGRYTLTV
ncbi:MAG: flavin reductase family protein [Bryobacterales bacterium]|nr:flavin reductase family protein [Bryobacterales bacterium]